MDLIEAIESRRSVKQFTERVPTRQELERLLQLATLPPNHRMTQPWRFYVMGPEAHARYAALKAELKSRKVEDEAAAAAVREKVERGTLAIPAVVAVAMPESEDEQTREEDHAAVFMGLENLLLAAQSMGLGGYIHTGRIMNFPELREALGVPEGQRVVALLDLGEPAELPSPKPRASASDVTHWTS